MIPYVRQFDFEHGRCERVSLLVERVIAANPGPFTYTGTGTYILGHARPGSGVGIIDPGPLDDTHLEALVKAVQGRHVTHILVTHRHRDHAPLARPLSDRVGNPPILARPSSRRPVHASLSVDEEEDHAFLEDHALVDGELIKGDGWTLETVATPGHTSDHACFALIEENALFSGDHIMGWSTSVVAPPDGDMADYMASLERIMARGFSTLWPTHGPPVTAPAPFLAAYHRHRIDREHQILTALSAGPTRITDMVPKLYAAVDSRLWPAASLSVLAHLIKLTGENRVTADGPPAMDALYQLSAG